MGIPNKNGNVNKPNVGVVPNKWNCGTGEGLGGRKGSGTTGMQTQNVGKRWQGMCLCVGNDNKMVCKRAWEGRVHKCQMRGTVQRKGQMGNV